MFEKSQIAAFSFQFMLCRINKTDICKRMFNMEFQKMCVDDIMLLKPFNDCLSGPITGSINTSVNTGSFPRELKTATRTLTLKPGIFQYCVIINPLV